MLSMCRFRLAQSCHLEMVVQPKTNAFLLFKNKKSIFPPGWAMAGKWRPQRSKFRLQPFC
uniref:Uncharacterized protein n=1 Tax=Anguilla anguilla TaxID=7936 RepID=A0A0E9SHM9_ANGAN